MLCKWLTIHFNAILTFVTTGTFLLIKALKTVMFSLVGLGNTMSHMTLIVHSRSGVLCIVSKVVEFITIWVLLLLITRF